MEKISKEIIHEVLNASNQVLTRIYDMGLSSDDLNKEDYLDLVYEEINGEEDEKENN